MKRTFFKDTAYTAVLFVSMIFSTVEAGQFALPPANEALLGELAYTTATRGETPASVAERYNIGLNAIVAETQAYQKQRFFPVAHH